MPRTISDDELRTRLRKGEKLTTADGKRVSFIKPASSATPADKDAEAVRTLANAAIRAVEQAGLTVQISDQVMRSLLSRLEELANPSAPVVNVTVEDEKWTQAEVTVTARDRDQNIKTLVFKKK